MGGLARISRLVIALSILGVSTWAEEQLPLTPEEMDSLLATIGAKSSGWASWMPYYMDAAPSPHPASGGIVDLSVVFVPRRDSGEFRVEVTTVDNLELLSIGSPAFSSGIGDTTRFTLRLDIPNLDTSGVMISVISRTGRRFELPAYFVAEADTVKFWLMQRHTLDRRVRNVGSVRRPALTNDSSSGRKEEQVVLPTTMAFFYDEAGKIVPQDSVENGVSFDGRRVGSFDSTGNFIATDSILRVAAIQRESRRLSDSVLSLPGGPKEWTIVVDSAGNQYIVSRQYYRDSLEAVFERLLDSAKAAKVQGQADSMHQLEKSALTDLDVQFFSVGDKTYRRNKGEYLFSETHPIQDRSAHFRAKRDSMRSADPDRPREYLLDLRDPNEYAEAAKVADSIHVTARDGFYRVFLKPDAEHKLRDQGIIRKAMMDTREREPQDSASGSTLPRPKSGGDSDTYVHRSDQAMLIFIENFGRGTNRAHR